MKKIVISALALALLGAAPAYAQSADAKHVEVLPSGTSPAFMGPAKLFTGSVVVEPMFAATEHTHATGALVVFTPGARTAWHTHPGGQLLVVTQGTGWIQEDGQAKKVMKAGDTVWIPPGVKHWHGATDKNGMSHIAISYMVGGKNVNWMELVSDEQFLK